MFKNYFKIAFRNLWRHKFLSVTNIMGLAVGIACCLMIALYILHETSYDSFHSKANRLVRVNMEFTFDGKATNIAVTGTKVFPAFKRTFPEVENGVRMYPDGAVVKIGDKLFDEKGFVYADSTFFDLFSFKLLQGNPHTVLARPNQVVLSRSIAQKYFGNENPVGKRMLIDNKIDFVVSGVVEDCPTNSQIKYDLIGSFYSLTDYRYVHEQWWDASFYTYLLLKHPEDIKSLQAKILGYMKTQAKENELSGNNYMTFHLEPMKEVHLKARVEGGFEPGSDYRYMYIFGAIALLILSIAFANYVNLTTARAAERAREVGVRKVMGALRNQLFGQFMGESVLTVFTALLVSLFLLKLFLPVFNMLADRQLQFSLLAQPGALIVLLAILVVPGLLGGIYPALILSSFQPVRVLKGNFKTGTSGIWLRKGLIVLQFVICVGLIVCTLIIQSQLNYIQNKKLGYNKDHVLVLPADGTVQKNSQVVKSMLLANSSITGVAFANQSPAFIPSTFSLSLNGRDIIANGLRTDRDFISTMGIELRSGTNFTLADEQFADSGNMQHAMIINEATMRLLGWTPENAIGKTVNFRGGTSIIRGVVKDFHFSSMHEAISPLVIFIARNKNNLLVKLSGEHLPQTIDYLKAKWAVLAPHLPFTYEFLDEQFDKLYSSETRTGKLFYSFAMLAIALACLGLLGLSTYTAQQRAKEIGIRKVLGASVASVMVLLSKEFLKLVGIAALIASPLAWWATHQWLQGFAYRVSIQPWVFVLAIAVAMLIVILTVSMQVLKAALANPVKSLRSE